jgi:four helix bundle protein
MTPRELKERTSKFAHAIVAFSTPLLTLITVTDLARQLLRAGTAVDSNYGSAQRARSHREFTSRIGVVFDEASESLGWLQLLEPSEHARNEKFRWLLGEAEELTRIFNKAYETARAKEEADRKKRRHRQPRRAESNNSDHPPDPSA